MQVLTIYLPTFVNSFLQKRLGGQINLVHRTERDDNNILMLKRQIIPIIENSKMIHKARFKRGLQKRNTKSFPIVYSKHQSLTHEQINKISQLIWNFFQNEIFFELMVTPGNVFEEKLRNIIVKYEMEDLGVKEIKNWIDYKKKKVL